MRFIEFFSGRGTIASAFASAGLGSLAFDLLKSPAHDLSQPLGIYLAMLAVLALPVGAALLHFILLDQQWDAPTLLRVSIRSRRAKLRGNWQFSCSCISFLLDSESRALADALLCGATREQKPFPFQAALLWIGFIRGCAPTLEQPRGSVLMCHPTMQALIRFLDTYMGQGDMVGEHGVV